ncbi:GFA family protein [Rhizobium sp. BR 317]|uniref:GFA family protein n=1 Tax=Rhizobium sp. BR 317 TaxID=3040015 RepID=UPI0039BEF395
MRRSIRLWRRSKAKSAVTAGWLWRADRGFAGISRLGQNAAFERAPEWSGMLMLIGSCHCGKAGWTLEGWRGLRLQKDGRRRIAVNLRLAPPDLVSDLPIDHFDGLDTFEDLPSKGRCVRDLWF